MLPILDVAFKLALVIAMVLFLGMAIHAFRERQKYSLMNHHLSDVKERLEDERERLQEQGHQATVVLEAWIRHLPTCAIEQHLTAPWHPASPPRNAPTCTCGLNEALKTLDQELSRSLFG